MSIKDTVQERRLRRQADSDIRTAKEKVRKAIDLKDPRFLGEAALAATRGPAGLAWFAASKGMQATRERSAHLAEVASETVSTLGTDLREEPAAYVKSNKAASRKARAAAKRELARVRKSQQGPLRRYAPLWVTGLLGGVAVAGGTAYFLRDQKPSSPAPKAPTTSPAAGTTPDTADPEGRPDQPMDATSAAAAGLNPTNMGTSAAAAPQPEEGGDTGTN